MKLYLLTTDEAATLNPDERRIYDRAARLVECEWANGPNGGWADGHDLLESLGWMRQQRGDGSGFRFYETMVKPERFCWQGP